LFAEERRRMIAADLQVRGRVLAGELAKRYGVTEETIRRDLKWLEAAGKAVRTHGGALWRGEAGLLPPLAIRQGKSYAAKRAIGAYAAGLVNDGQAIFIDSGSTALELARSLRQKKNLHVVTNSLLVANELATGEGIEVHMPGGTLRADEMCLVGPEAVAGLAHYRADLAFISCAGVDPKSGVAVYNSFQAEVKRAMLRHAARRVLLVDSTKLGQVALVQVAKCDEFDLMITDSGAGEDKTILFRQAGVEVAIA